MLLIEVLSIVGTLGIAGLLYWLFMREDRRLQEGNKMLNCYWLRKAKRK